MAGFVQRMNPISGIDAAKIQGDSVSVKDPSVGQGLVWDDYTKQWVPKEQISVIYSVTAPANPTEGARWVDTTTLREYEFYSGAWVEVGSVPAVVPSASESTPGIVQLATDAETQTGTDPNKVPPVSALAAWWTWVKTQAQTFTGNLTLNGTSNTAPNQTAASGSSLMTRDLVDARFLDNRLLGLRPISTIPSSYTATLVGSGGRGVTSDSIDIFTGATPSSSAVVNNRPSGLMYFAYQGGSTIDWAKSTRLDFQLVIGSASTNSVFRLLFGCSPTLTTVSDLDRRGIGVKIDNLSLKLQVHDGTTLTTSAALTALSTATVYGISLKKAASSGTVECFVNGSSVGQTTGGPSTPPGSSADGFSLSITNGADSLSARFTVQFPMFAYT